MKEEEILEQVQKTADLAEKINKSLGNKVDKDEFTKVKDALEKLSAGNLTVDEYNKKAKEVNDAMDKITKMLEESQGEIAKLKDGNGRRGVRKTFGMVVVEAIQKAGLQGKKLSKGFQTLELPEFDARSLFVKNSATMTTANVTPSDNGAVPFELAEFEAGLTRIVRRQPWLLQIANVSPIGKMYAQWAEQANPDGTAGETSEGSAKNKIDFDWVEKSAKVEKKTAYIKVSEEALDDLDGLQNEIDAELTETVLLAVDAGILSDDGSSPSLNGLLNQDTDFAAGGLASSVILPTNSDVLRAAISQISRAHFKPDYILLHPDDVALMDLEKAPDGHYTMRPFVSADGLLISGVKILENTGQTAGQFTVGDFSKLNVRIRKGMTVEVGRDDTDFTLNLMTIRGEMRLVVYVKTNHQAAFVTGVFADCIPLLAKP